MCMNACMKQQQIPSFHAACIRHSVSRMTYRRFDVIRLYLQYVVRNQHLIYELTNFDINLGNIIPLCQLINIDLLSQTQHSNAVCLFVSGTIATPPQWATVIFIQEVSRSHTRHHRRYDSYGRVISPSQRTLPDNTQHSQQTDMPPVRFEPTISAGERPQTYETARPLGSALNTERSFIYFSTTCFGSSIRPSSDRSTST